MKRINATDIAAAFNEANKEEEVCGKAFCKFGCVCGSIDGPKHLRTHCGLIECVFGCVCTSPRRSKRTSYKTQRYMSYLSDSKTHN